MRNAACSWARATIRSASSWAFSMIRSPSELMRFAARTSSGTATRSSSMRPSAAAWSMTTLFVRGSRLPFAMIDSRRSTRKMMSIWYPPATRRPGRRVVGRDYRTVPRPSTHDLRRRLRGVPARGLVRQADQRAEGRAHVGGSFVDWSGRRTNQQRKGRNQGSARGSFVAWSGGRTKRASSLAPAGKRPHQRPTAAAGIIADTSPSNVAISLTRLDET